MMQQQVMFQYSFRQQIAGTRSLIELGGKDSNGNLVTLMLGGDGDFGGYCCSPVEEG